MIVKMPCWYYDKKELKNTASAQDNIDHVTEMRYRKEGARFIIDVGKKMDLGYNTTATGVVYFHRFYMFHSFRQFPRYVTACCCLLLAGKVEETPKKCKDIIKAAQSLLSVHKFGAFGDDPKEEVITLERILLQTIKFDLQVEHPYGYLLRYAKCLKGDEAKLHKMVQMAWTFVNDSLCTTLALQWEPEIIAVALMYLAGKLSKFEVVDWSGRTAKHLRWWDMFVEDVTMDLLEDICHQVLDLYSQAGPSDGPESPPLVPRSGKAAAALTTSPASTDASPTVATGVPPSTQPGGGGVTVLGHKLITSNGHHDAASSAAIAAAVGAMGGNVVPVVVTSGSSVTAIAAHSGAILTSDQHKVTINMVVPQQQQLSLMTPPQTQSVVIQQQQHAPSLVADMPPHTVYGYPAGMPPPPMNSAPPPMNSAPPPYGGFVQGAPPPQTMVGPIMGGPPNGPPPPHHLAGPPPPGGMYSAPPPQTGGYGIGGQPVLPPPNSAGQLPPPSMSQPGGYYGPPGGGGPLMPTHRPPYYK